MVIPLFDPQAAMFHGIDDVFFHQRFGNTEALGNFVVGQAFNLAQQKTVTTQLW